jgi:signal transduction histidine kinase/CheY-like chemotaxis protein
MMKHLSHLPPDGCLACDAHEAQFQNDDKFSYDFVFRIERISHLLYAPLALTVILSTLNTEYFKVAVCWTCFLVVMQFIMLTIHKKLSEKGLLKQAVVCGTWCSVIPFAILPIVLLEHLDLVQHMFLTLSYALIVAGVITLTPSFSRLHHIYIISMLGGITFSWLLSQSSQGSATATIVAVLAVSFAAACEHLRKRTLLQQSLIAINAHLASSLADKVNELEQRNEARAQWLTAACHDLRQATHASGLLIEAILEGRAEHDWQRRMRTIQRTNVTINNLLTEAIDFVRLDVRTQTVKLSAVCLQEVLSDARELFAIHADHRGITLNIASSNCSVNSEPNLLRRVLFNLISNAIKYTNAGTVSVSLEERGDVVEMCVCDTGMGIERVHLSRIFQQYTRLTEDDEGLGIGLAVVKRTCELLSHPLSVESQPGQGTRFLITLPLLERSIHVSSGDSVVWDQPGPRATHPEGWIAVVDDDHVARQALTDLLQSWGHDVCATQNSVEVLRLIEQRGFKPRILVTDIHLRAESGFNVIDAVNEHSAEGSMSPIILTGDSATDLQHMAMDRNAVLLYKPVMPCSLRAILAVK